MNPKIESTKVTIEFPTNNKKQAVHTLDMSVMIFNHWYGGSVEYTLKELSYEGKKVKKGDKVKLEAIKVLKDKWLKDGKINSSEYMSNLMGVLDGWNNPLKIIDFDEETEVIR